MSKESGIDELISKGFLTVRGAYNSAYKIARKELLLEIIDKIESTDWYHINKNGELVHGANSKEEGTEPLYIAEDILNILREYEVE